MSADTRDNYPIMVLCGAAGSLRAYQHFFEAMTEGIGIALVVVQQGGTPPADPLSDTLRRYTRIPVVVIEDGLQLQPGRVYVCPPNETTSLQEGRFRLARRNTDDDPPRPADQLLSSVALEAGNRVVAIILSGAGTDGVDGSRAVVRNGGRVIVQDLLSASDSSMPEAVIEAGIATVALPPEQMPEYLAELLDRSSAAFSEWSNDIALEDLEVVIQQIRQQTGRNFADYKYSTMRRQISRRVAQLQLGSIDAYISHMRAHPEEAEILGDYLLINVTSFFRDPEVFDNLKHDVIKPLLEALGPDEIFRVWVAGCASGEEAISIAIIVHECLHELNKQMIDVRIFATDTSKQLIQQARSGRYPASIVDDVAEHRLADNFIQEETGYRVRNHIMRMIIWSEHNLIENPPFSKLHLISCRNVLIYFQKRLQERVLTLFQFALREGGILLLGTSETLPHFADVFAAVNPRQKIFRNVSADTGNWLYLNRPFQGGQPFQKEVPVVSETPSEADSSYELRVIKNMLVEHFNATCFIVDNKYQLLYSYGEVDRYLSLVPGKHAPITVLDMAREGLDIDLTVALHDAFEHEEKVVEQKRVWVRTNGDERLVNLIIKPMVYQERRDRVKLVIIELVAQGRNLLDVGPTDTVVDGQTDADRVDLLKEERDEAKEALRTITQALQAKSEELTASMEEISSANEEVQTTNEELRTSKEELESMNEELNTLNVQLTDQNEELTRANDTLQNFLQSAEIGMVILDRNMLVQEFTRAVSEFIPLRPEDRGRPLADLTHELDYDELLQDAKHVLSTLEHIDREVQTTGDRWLSARMRPYRTTSDVINGVVITLNDVTHLKAAQQAAETQAAYMQRVFDTLGDGLLELDSDLRVTAANASFYRTFSVDPAATLGRQLYALGNGQWDIPDLRRLLQEVIPAQSVVLNYEVDHVFPSIGRRTMRLNARKVTERNQILLVITDVSEVD